MKSKFFYLCVCYCLLCFACKTVFCRKARIFCLIHTATPSHDTRAKTVYETWAQQCDDFVFFTNSPMDSNIPHVVYPNLFTRDHSWEKIRRIFNYVAETKIDQNDWFIRADDDAYVLVENARAFLSNYSSSDNHFFGLKWSFFVSHGFADGSCYILSRAALGEFNKVMKDPAKCPDHHRAEEDQEIARCLAHAGIYPEDSRDEVGADRFQHFHPLEQLVMYQDSFAQKYSYYPIREGEDNFSSQMISFHHVSPYEMRFIHFLMNDLNLSPV
ncbi:unnamed protein product [Auanema sp. JU1783]|nr:unnamed protein product [Auanema sp. JU1783]